MLKIILAYCARLGAALDANWRHMQANHVHHNQPKMLLYKTGKQAYMQQMVALIPTRSPPYCSACLEWKAKLHHIFQFMKRELACQ